VAQVSKRAELLAQLVGELLAILLGLWMTFGLGWEEFGPGLVLFGAIGFAVTCARMWKACGELADDEPPAPIGPVT
jgi:hypothetical protein